MVKYTSEEGKKLVRGPIILILIKKFCLMLIIVKVQIAGDYWMVASQEKLISITQASINKQELLKELSILDRILSLNSIKQNIL